MAVPMGAGVTACMTARAGGVSPPPWDTCNLGDHVGDDPERVRRNRAVLAAHLPARPVFLDQVHGETVVRLSGVPAEGLVASVMRADGAVCTEPGVACVVMVADCLPILLSAPEGRGVAALHAGWRGLAGSGSACPSGRGIVHTGVRALCEATGADPHDLRAWLGPCIGPQAFEVGADVLAGFGLSARAGEAAPRFAPRSGHVGKWLADLPGLARDRLAAIGVRQIEGGQWCTVSAAGRFFSHRRDGRSGRQAAAICLNPL
jgi:YfiH family protein